MKSPKTMTCNEMEREVIANRKLYAAATLEQKRTLIHRGHELMVEMDSRWNKKEGK